MQEEEPESPLRRLKAEEISKFVIKLRENLFEVQSQSKPGVYYHVRTGTYAWSCTCEDFIHRGGKCKHQIAVAIFVNKEIPTHISDLEYAGMI